MTEEFGFGTTTVEEAAAMADTEIPPEVDGGDFEFQEDTGAGQFPPRITPGPVNFRVEIINFQTRYNKVNVKINEITYTAHVQVPALGPGRLLNDKGESEIAVRFNRESDYKSAKMREKKVQSGFERLYQALGLLAEFGAPKSKTQLVEMLRGASGRTAQGDLVWTAARKLENGTTEIFSTSPNPKREKGWPRGTDGKLVTQVTFADGSTKMAREGIGRLRSPKVKK